MQKNSTSAETQTDQGEEFDPSQTEIIDDISSFTVTTPGGQRMNGDDYVKFVNDGSADPVPDDTDDDEDSDEVSETGKIMAQELAEDAAKKASLAK